LVRVILSTFTPPGVFPKGSTFTVALLPAQAPGAKARHAVKIAAQIEFVRIFYPQQLSVKN
jgi:hypothetical protein